MNAIVIEHVALAELPLAWREKLGTQSGKRVTVRIETEAVPAETQDPLASAPDPLFGMWRDRAEMADVGRYVRNIRASQFNQDSRHSGSSLSNFHARGCLHPET